MAIILVVDEAVNAMKRKEPSDSRLIKIMNGYDEKTTMPTSEEARWLAAFVLKSRGHIFNRAPKTAKGTRK